MYISRLLIEYLMFSDDIQKDLDELSDAINIIDINSINELIDTIKNQNIYTNKNLNNFKYILKYLNIENYEEKRQIIDNAESSNDIYYYEYLEKFDVLNRSINEKYITISKEMIECSIRYDFIACYILNLQQKFYENIYPQTLLNNKLFLMFIKKILNEQPDLLLNKKIYKRLNSILDNYIKDGINVEELKKEIYYFRKNKYAETFDYGKFKYLYMNSFFKYIITNNVDIKRYHNYIINDEFIYYLKEEIEIYDQEECKDYFPYSDEMKMKIRKILNYILDYRQDFKYKEIYNILRYKLDKKNQKIDFYKLEYLNKKQMIVYLSKDHFESDIKYMLKKEYEIFSIYTLSDDEFKKQIVCINDYIYINFFNPNYKNRFKFFIQQNYKR